MRKLTGNNPYKPYSAQILQKQDEHNIYVIMKACMLICSSCFCEIWALCVPWIIYDHLFYTPCLAWWTFFGSLVPTMYNRMLCAQVHKLLQSHCDNNRRAHCFHDNTWKQCAPPHPSPRPIKAEGHKGVRKKEKDVGCKHWKQWNLMGLILQIVYSRLILHFTCLLIIIFSPLLLL